MLHAAVTNLSPYQFPPCHCLQNPELNLCQHCINDFLRNSHSDKAVFSTTGFSAFVDLQSIISAKSALWIQSPNEI